MIKLQQRPRGLGKLQTNKGCKAPLWAAWAALGPRALATRKGKNLSRRRGTIGFHCEKANYFPKRATAHKDKVASTKAGCSPFNNARQTIPKQGQTMTASLLGATALAVPPHKIKQLKRQPWLTYRRSKALEAEERKPMVMHEGQWRPHAWRILALYKASKNLWKVLARNKPNKN